MRAEFRCIGGIDVDPAAMSDFEKLAGVPGTCMDLFSRQQYIAFHGQEPPEGWREMVPADVMRAQGGEHPHIVFLSAPCKGFSGLLSEKRSKTDKYQALNELTLRGVWLTLEANASDPVELYVFENVPRIASRGAHLVSQIKALFERYGYAVSTGDHDCGELGGLAQSRKRFLLVARHIEKVPPFLYQPDKRSLLAVGDILGRMPMPGDMRAGQMHRVPRLQWKTWVRLAFVEAGSDWRSLNKLRVVDGELADYLIMPACHSGMLGVNRWDESAGTITSRGRPNNGNFAIADPRLEQSDKWTDGQAFGVRSWDAPTGTVTSKNIPGQGPYSVADPRHHGAPKHNNEYRVVQFDKAAMSVTGAHGKGQCVADPRGPERAFTKFAITQWDGNTGTVIGGHGPSHGAYGVADPRPDWENRYGNLAVTDWEKHSSTVIAGGKGVQGGWLSVADPRPNCLDENREAYLTGGHYGVVPWGSHSGAISAHAKNNNGRWSVADPRIDMMPAQDEKLVAVIRALDGTWHRPFTTLELAALQSLIDPEEHIELFGLSDSSWRERIGNAVPPAAAQAIASVMGQTLLLAWSGTTFMLSSQPIWVQPIATLVSLETSSAA